jgi:GxxExxY protein
MIAPAPDVRPPLSDDALDRLSREVFAAAARVHSALGPGLLESAYEMCLQHELKRCGIETRRQVPVPFEYEGLRVHSGFRIDLLVEEELIVELKASERLPAVAEAQMLTYLRLAGKRLGLLINFNVTRIRDGVRRYML